MCSASCLSFPLTLEPAEPMRSSKLSSFAWITYGGAITTKKRTQSPVEQPEQREMSLRALISRVNGFSSLTALGLEVRCLKACVKALIFNVSPK